jgi:hypothetical protein
MGPAIASVKVLGHPIPLQSGDWEMMERDFEKYVKQSRMDEAGKIAGYMHDIDPERAPKLSADVIRTLESHYRARAADKQWSECARDRARLAQDPSRNKPYLGR